EEIGLILVQACNDLGNRAVDLEATHVDEPLCGPAADRRHQRDARVVAVDCGVVTDPELAFALALGRPLPRSPVATPNPVLPRVDEVADLARGAGRVNHPVLAEEELGRVVRAR